MNSRGRLIVMVIFFRPHTKFLTPERAFKVCIFETFVCCAVTSPGPVITVYDGTSRCIAIQLDSAITKAVTSVVSVTYVIMFLIVCVCYTKVALTIRRKLIQTHDVVERREKGSGNNQPGTNQPIENVDSSKTSSIKCLRGRICKIHPFADSDCGTKESKIIPTPVKGSKEIVFENVGRYPHVTNESRLGDLDEKHKTSSTTVQGNVKRLMLVDSRVNRTTKIMFAVTLVFLGSWIPTWIVIFYKQLNEADKSLGGEIFATFGEKSFMLNTFTNPIFYICLSTVFKQRAKQLVKNLFTCRKRDQRSHTG